MIRVCYSNRIERLVAALGDQLAPPGDLDAMFAGPWLVVPNRPLETYVDLELARRRGFSGNIDTMSMPGMFTRLCADALPDVVLIERGHIVGELLAVLSDLSDLSDPGLPDNADLAPLTAYLGAAGTAPEAVDRRRVDVARALGALFDDWMLARPELCASLGGQEAGKPQGRSASTQGLEPAERALWKALFGIDGRFARRGASEQRRYLALPDVLAQGLDEAWRPPRAIHVFGLSQVPRGLQIAFGHLGARTDLTLYAVNPCREFWEDLNTRRRASVPAAASRSARGAKGAPRDTRQMEFAGLSVPPPADSDFEQSAATGDNSLLRLWGHAGRQATRLLNDLSDGGFDDRFVDPIGTARPTLLRRLQRSLLDRQDLGPVADDREDGLDDSVVILGAPSPRRELETIAAEIWAMVRADAALRFSDVAVLIAGPDEPYLSLARAVFREAAGLPHTIVDQPLATTSQLVEAVIALSALPLGQFTRREVLDVITHPNVRARFPEVDPQNWLELCEALTIAYGADREDFHDTYVDTDVFNWDQGCKRLALGVFARGPRSGVEDPIVLPGTEGPCPYLPAEVAPDLRPDADALALLARSLLADARYARTARMPIAAWMGFVRALVSAYVFPTSADDEAARLRVFATLDRIAAEAAPDLSVSLGVAHQLIRAALIGLRSGRGQILGAGVTVGTLGALRAMPFRVIFVAGLGPERYPAPDRPSPLDLDADRHRANEVTPRQQDRYLMLDTLLAAREKLILSYLDRDALTGEAREPSPVVLEFLDELRRATGRPLVTRRAPLHRDEDSQVRAAFPGVAAEAQARELGEALRTELPEVARLDITEIVRGLSSETRTALEPLLRTTTPPSPAADARAQRSETRLLQLADLRHFLECPLQGSARVFLGLRDLPDDSDARAVGDEPFGVPRYIERSLLGDVFAAAWSAPGIPDESTLVGRYDAAILRQRTMHILPAGLFRDSVRRRHLAILRQWALSLGATEHGDTRSSGPLARVCFGRPQPFAPPADLRDPIRLTVDVRGLGPRTVEIHGTTEPQLAFGAQSGSLVLATADAKEKNDKDSLRAFIDYVALAASAPEHTPPVGFAGAICRPSKDGSPSSPHPISFAPLDRGRARAYLTDLVAELLGDVHDYLFPCDAVFFSARREELPLSDRIKQIQTDSFLRDHCSSRFGPVPDPFSYRVPDSDEADRLQEKRFGLFFGMRGAPPSPARSRRKS